MAPRNSMLDRGGASDSEDDLATTNVGAQSRGLTAKLNASKTDTMPPKRGSTATKRKAPTKTTNNRPALKDRTNIQHGTDTEEPEEGEDDYDAKKPKSKRAKTTATQKAPAKAASTKSKTTAKRAPAAEALAVIPETQPDPTRPEDVSISIEAPAHNDDDGENMDVATIPTPPKIQHFIQRARSTSVQPAQQQPIQPLPVRASARSVSAQPQSLSYPPPRERSGSASGTERRGGDPELRRQLNETNKKYENLNLKYQNLQELAQQGAQKQFQKLKAAGEAKSKSAEEVIAALRREVEGLKKSLKGRESGGAGEQMEKKVAALKGENEGLTTELGSVKASLQVAQNEVKALEAKLVVARQQLSNQASSAQESNNAKGSVKGNATVPVNATDAQKEAKMIQNLYSDLTGLIVRSVKRKDVEDEYDCIQTGRNGTLHFHLSIANDASIANPKTPSGLSYEEAEFAYEPLLDESRDRDLMELLPDYLTEEICFPRNQAVKFYGKVGESMTKKVVVEE